MKILLAPTYEIAKGITADATVEAEYGDACVEGRIATLAHHGPRSGNPAPCNTENVPVLDDGSVVLVSHIDLDTLGGVLALMGKKPDDTGFWAGAEKIDVAGPHHIHELPEPVQDKLNAYYAWSEKQGRKRYTELADVTNEVMAASKAVDIICDHKNPEHDEYIKTGREWVAKTTQAVEKCLVHETGHARGFVTDGSTFCLGSYYSPNDNRIHPATVQYNGKTKAVSIAFADWNRHGLKANEIVQSLWGPEAGGREGIAGSPRGQEMTLDDFENAFRTVDTLLKEKELADKEIPLFANTIITVYEQYLENNFMDITNGEKDKEIEMLDDGTRSYMEIQGLIEGQPVIFGSDRRAMADAIVKAVGSSLPEKRVSRDEALGYARKITDAFMGIMKERGYFLGREDKIPETSIDRSKLMLEVMGAMQELQICDEEIYYGVVQSNHGHDYVHIYTYSQIREEFDRYGLDKNLLPLPGEEESTACLDVLWPIGGSNSSASFIAVLNGEKEAAEFITQEALGPDYEDPELIDLAEYIWTLDTDEGCMQEFLDRYGIDPEQYSQHDPRVDDICRDYGIQKADFYSDEIRDIRYSEIGDKLPGAIRQLRGEDHDDDELTL